MDKQWFNKTIEEVKEQLKVNTQGLSDEQVKEKREIYGLNELQSKKKKSLIVKFLEQFKDFMIIILIIAAVISGAVGYYQGEGITDSIIILIVVIVNAIIGVAQESKAEKSLEALQKLSSFSFGPVIHLVHRFLVFLLLVHQIILDYLFLNHL